MLCLIGAPGGIRTPDLQVRSLTFYPAKLQAHVGLIKSIHNKIIIMPNDKDVNS